MIRQFLLRCLRRQSAPDLQAFFESLSPVRVGRAGYSAADQRRDFRATFATPQGRRVLHQIIARCEGRPLSETDADQPGRMAFHAGARAVGHWLIQTLNAEPFERPDRGQNQEVTHGQ